MGVSLRCLLKNPVSVPDFKNKLRYDRHRPGRVGQVRPRGSIFLGLFQPRRSLSLGLALLFFFVCFFSCSARQVALRALEPEIKTLDVAGQNWVLPAISHLSLLQVRREISLRLPPPRTAENPTNMGERVRPNPLPYLEAFLVNIPKEQNYHIHWAGVGVEVDGVSISVLTPALFRSNYPASRYDTEGFVTLTEEGGNRRVLFTEAWPMGARRVVWTFPVFVGTLTNETTPLMWTNDTRWVRRSFDGRSTGGLP